MNDGENTGSSHWRLYALVGLMTFLWAVNYVVAKYTVRHIPPMMAAGMRTALAGLFIWPIYFWERRTTPGSSWKRADVPMLVMLGMFGVTLNQLFFVMGIGKTSVAHAAVILGMTPILVLVIACAIGLESISIPKLIGMALALAGVTALQLAPSRGVGTTAAGDVLILMAALTFSLFTVLGKRVANQFGSITVNTFAYVGGGLTLLPITIWQASGVSLSAVNWTVWASIAYMAAFPSVLCYLIYYYALKRIPASRVSAFAYLQPLIAMLLAIPAFGESPSASMLTGGCLVLTGVYVAERV